MLQRWIEALTAVPAPVLAFVAIQLALILLAVPLWTALVDRWRWSGLRGEMIDAALAAYEATNMAAVRLSRDLFRENGATPLERLCRVRQAIEEQAAASARFERNCAMLGPAANGRTAPAMIATAGFCDATADIMRAVVDLYLREATVRVGSNAVYGDDLLCFRPGQIVSTRYPGDLRRLANMFVEHAAESCAALRRANRGGRRRARGARLDDAAGHAAILATDIDRFVARLQPADPESPDYRSRPRGEVAARTLDGLIARFDRGGLVRALQSA